MQSAKRKLRAKGFRVQVKPRVEDAFDPGTIIEYRPILEARPGHVVTLIVAKAPGGGCHPSYSGCVPIASDVDCHGGEGNGPDFISGPVTVIGNDVYNLDRNNDGIGCE